MPSGQAAPPWKPRPGVHWWEIIDMKQLIRRVTFGALGTGLLATGMLAAAPATFAKGTDVIRTGNCSAASDWKLKAKPDNGRLEVEFEVDQNRNGQVWNVTLTHNGSQFFSGQRTTQAPSGSFSLTRFTNNAAGSDMIVGRAVNPKTGEVCRGSLSI
jgi:2-methylaconitate cis-trans-isomerase PrpF